MTIIKCLLNASHGNENGKNVAHGAWEEFRDFVTFLLKIFLS